MARWGEHQADLVPLQVAGPDGCPIRAWRGGTGPVLLLIHGLGWDHSLWAGDIARLSAAYTVVAVDLRGHGASGRPPGPYAIETMARDVLAVADQVAPGRLALAGFSLGGLVALELARLLGPRLSALVVAGSGARRRLGHRERTAEFVARMRALGPRGFAEAQGEIVFGERFRREQPEEVARFIAWRTAMPSDPLFDAMLASPDFDATPVLTGLACPVLAVAAMQDPFVTPAEVAHVAESAPRGQFVRIHDSGHHMMIEQPADFAAALDPFLRTVHGNLHRQ